MTLNSPFVVLLCGMKSVFFSLLLLCGTTVLYAQKPALKSTVVTTGVSALIESNELWVYIHEEPEDAFVVVDSFKADAELVKLLRQGRVPKKPIDSVTLQVKQKYPKAEGIIIRERKLEGDEQVMVFTFK
ncbi:hypothetical protein D3C71_50610 [compost metagenome]